jgi:hypothetical protein
MDNKSEYLARARRVSIHCKKTILIEARKMPALMEDFWLVAKSNPCRDEYPAF